MFHLGWGADLVAFSQGDRDVLDLSEFRTIHCLANVLAVSHQAGANMVITLGAGASLTLQDLVRRDLAASDFQFAQSALSNDLEGDRVADVLFENHGGVVRAFLCRFIRSPETC
jgi:hypothetical protein